mgnify:CR=1 FL=1
MNGEGEKQSYRLIFGIFFGSSDALNKIYRKKWSKILVVQKSSLPLQRNSESPGGGMVDALVSGASVERRAGSSPVLGTKIG